MFLRADFKGARNSKRVADRIGERFHDHERGTKISMAKAKDDQFIELKVHPYYKDNYPRYMQVIRNIVFKESLVEQRDRLEKLKDQLQNPDTSALAAIRMEAIGKEAIPFLKTGLNSVSREVRFYSAEALAYMKDESGVEIMGECAKEERAFRAYAFAALASLNEPSGNVELTKLLDDDSPEVKYGAFRALWTIDRNEPAIKGVRLNDEFNFHPLRTQGEPMVHMTRNRVSEVVLFGSDIRLNPPLALKAGSKISINATAGAERITISKFEVGQKDERRVVEPKLYDVILTVAELGATYPDVARMLMEAKSQHNLDCRVEVDALPQVGRVYYRSKEEQDLANARGGRGKEKTTIGRENLGPNTTWVTEDDVKDDQVDPYADKTASMEDGEEEVAGEEAGESSSTDITPTSGSEGGEEEGAEKSESKFRSKIKNLNLFRSKEKEADESE